MDSDAFERVAVAHKDRLYGYAVRFLRNPAEAQDVTQEALLRLWRESAGIDELGARPWLLRTAHNLCIDRLRRIKHEPSQPAEADGEAMTPDRGPGPLECAAGQETWRLIESALGRLSEQDRAVLVLREVEELSYEEIATMLALPLGTLKARLHRARERLRDRLVRAGVSR